MVSYTVTVSWNDPMIQDKVNELRREHEWFFDELIERLQQNIRQSEKVLVCVKDTDISFNKIASTAKEQVCKPPLWKQWNVTVDSIVRNQEVAVCLGDVEHV